MSGSAPLQIPASSNEDLQTLAHTYTQPLIRYFLRRGVPAESAEDCAQEVFLRLAKMSGPAIENPQAYLFTIAASVTIDRARKLKSTQASKHVSFENLFLSDHTPGPARVLEGREALAQLDRALRELPAKTREIFLLNRLEGLTYTQLATRYGITIKGIEKQMSRALAHIRERLAHAQ